MTVARLLANKGRDVVTIAADETLGRAAALLAQRRIGAVLVTSADGGIRGILSERDVVRALAQAGEGALSAPVSSQMTAKVVTCREDTAVRDVMEMMTAGKFRHVPVVDGDRLVGIVSIGDVVKARLDEAHSEAEAMRSYIHAA